LLHNIVQLLRSRDGNEHKLETKSSSWRRKRNWIRDGQGWFKLTTTNKLPHPSRDRNMINIPIRTSLPQLPIGLLSCRPVLPSNSSRLLLNCSIVYPASSSILIRSCLRPKVDAQWKRNACCSSALSSYKWSNFTGIPISQLSLSGLSSN
jgi:hypothetical protein